MSIIIGVLDIQGSVKEHFAMLGKIGVRTRLVKSPADLEKVNGLIIPGGESTTISKLLKTTRLDEEICRRARLNSRFPACRQAWRRNYWIGTKVPTLSIWGTCAGAILLSEKILQGAALPARPPLLGLMHISMERNAYGSQMDSFESDLNVKGLGERQFRAIFIRAPRVGKIGKRVAVLARQRNSPVMMQENNLLATTFHPELTADPRIHAYFLTLVQKYAAKKSKN